MSLLQGMLGREVGVLPGRYVCVRETKNERERADRVRETRDRESREDVNSCLSSNSPFYPRTHILLASSHFSTKYFLTTSDLATHTQLARAPPLTSHA